MSQEEIPLNPIAGWQVGPISAHRAVMLRLDFLTHPMQRPDEAHQTPQLVLTAPQAQELAEALQRAAGRATSGGPEGAGVPKH